MDKFSKLMLSRAQKIQNYLHKILEFEKTDSHSDDGILPKSQFEIRSDLSYIDDLGLGLPRTLPERVSMLFSRLSIYFEAGLLFKIDKTTSVWTPKSAFQEGDFFPTLSDKLLSQFSFPEMTLIEILRLRESPTHQTLKDIGLVLAEETQVLAFRPHPDYIFLVTSNLPDLWLKAHSEKIQSRLLMLLGDF